MKFSLLIQAVTYLVVLAGFGAIYFSGEISPTYSAVIGILYVLSLFLRFDYTLKTTVVIWNVIVVAIFLYFLISGFREGNWLLNAIKFSLFMVIAKLFQRRNARDYYQIYALSFLQIIGAAVINPGISFGIIFFIYLVLVTSGLILLTVLRDHEETASVSSNRAANRAIFERRDLIRPNLLALASGMAVIVFVMSIFIFFTFPRLGLGFFSVKMRKGVNVTGFSDRIELGGFGIIKDDPSVVMRVVLKQGAELTGGGPLRMRGMALDHYDGRQWLKTIETRHELVMDNDGNMRVDLSVAPLERDRLIEQEIYLEPLNSDTKVLFALPVFTAIKRVQSVMDIIKTYRLGFYRDFSDNVTFSGPSSMSLSYTAFSYPEERKREDLRLSPSEYDSLISKYFLQLPHVDEAVVKLAGEITRGAETPYDKALAIESYLRNNYVYSLNSVHPPDDPVKDFLLTNREGHCEYFASAMVILLRISGVPVRIVNGFYGGEFNSFGNFYAIKNGDAHSWVEVYFSGKGWVTFDPTPPSAFQMVDIDSFWKKVGNFLDAMKLKWYKWIIEYDLEKQIGITRALLLFLSGQKQRGFDTGFTMEEFKRLKRSLKGINVGKVIVFITLLSLALVFLYFLSKRGMAKKSPTLRASSAAARLYLKFLQKCSKKGFDKQSHETPYEFLQRLRDAGTPFSANAERFTALYVRAAFSDEKVPVEELREQLSLINKRL